MVAVEVILGAIGCLFCSIGTAFCLVKEEEKKRRENGIPGGLCGGYGQEQYGQQMPYNQQMQYMEDMRNNRIQDLEDYIRMQRAAAYCKYQQQAPGQAAAAPAPAPAPAPMMGGAGPLALPNPAARPLIYMQAPIAPYQNAPCFQPQPTAPFQMRNCNAPLAGAPIYYAR
jgi:hypothetical protein